MIQDIASEVATLKDGLQKLLAESSEACAYHPESDASQKCVKCQKPICTECAMQTKSGAYACQPCVEAYRTAKQVAQPVESAKTTATQQVHSAKAIAPRPAEPKPVAAKPVAAKPIAPTPIAAKPVSAKPIAPAPIQSVEVHEAEVVEISQINDPFASPNFFGGNLPSAYPTFPALQSNNPYQPAAPFDARGTITSGYDSFGQYTSGEKCAQHELNPVVHHCTICRAPLCRTCVFVFPPNITCCPKCATDTEIQLSAHRKWLIYGSLGSAISATLTMAILCSGLLSSAVDLPFVSFAIETLIVMFLGAGLGMAIGSINKGEGNTIMLWVAGIWNLIGLVGWEVFIFIIAAFGFLQ